MASFLNNFVPGFVNGPEKVWGLRSRQPAGAGMSLACPIGGDLARRRRSLQRAHSVKCRGAWPAIIPIASPSQAQTQLPERVWSAVRAHGAWCC